MAKNAFDATKDEIFYFTVSGGAQIVKNKIVGEYNSILHNGVHIFKKSERDGMLNIIYFNASNLFVFSFKIENLWLLKKF